MKGMVTACSKSSSSASLPEQQPVNRAMPSLIDIRRRIRSVKNTQQITKAMKMVSAAKLRRAQDRVIAARPYAAMLQQDAGECGRGRGGRRGSGESRCWRNRAEKRIQLLLLTADRDWPARSIRT